MSDLRPLSLHPDADQLNAFVEHALPAHENERTLAHLAICAHCRTIVALLIPETEELPKATLARAPWFSGWRLAWVGAPALAGLLVFAVYFRQGRPESHATKSLQTVDVVHPAASSIAPPIATSSLHSVSAAPQPKIRRSSEKAAAAVASPPPQAQMADALGKARIPYAMFAPRQAFSPLPSARPENVPQLAPLPSNLPILSMAAKGRERLALDRANTLFFSNDEGRTWNAVTPEWPGRIVKVSLLALSAPLSAQPLSAAPLRAPKIEAKRKLSSVGVIGGVMQGGIPTSVLNGVVTDPSGAAVPNAYVVVSNAPTPLVQTTNTDREGRYRIEGLAPGIYKVEAESPGFNKQSISVQVDPSQQSVANLKLTVGASTQRVQVEAAAALAAPDGTAGAFEVTTDTGDHWISSDGRTWTHQ